jgi:hypothetical protein
MTAQQRVWRQWGATNKQSAFSINQHLIWLLNQIQNKNRNSTLVKIWAMVQAGH